jgi:uncharacterized protein YdaU (DUF1376 family)
MSRAWMPLFWGDYLRDTRDLSTVQHGAYLLLIGHYWQHGGLPSDERQIAAITGLTPGAWRKIAPAIAAKFQNDWRHPRIDAEIAKVERAITQRRVAGAKGGSRTAIVRAIAVGSALATAQARPALRDVASAAAAAAASARASGPAKTQQPVSNQNQNQSLSPSRAESSAAREDPAGHADPPAAARTKRPHELTRAEIDAIHARRRGQP